jgi:hypothetical protein
LLQILGVQGYKGSSSPNNVTTTPTEGILDPENPITVQAFRGLAEVNQKYVTTVSVPPYNKYTKAVDRKGQI